MVDDPEVEDTASPCPPWCVSAHDDDAPGARVHRGPIREQAIRARRRRLADGALVGGPSGTTLFRTRLVRYEHEGEDWIAIVTDDDQAFEIGANEINRYVVLLGSTIVDLERTAG